MKLSMKIRAHEAELLVVGTEEEQTAEITRIMLQGCTAEVPSRLLAEVPPGSCAVRAVAPHQHSRRPSCRRSPRSAISPEEPCSELRAVHGARVCTEAYRSDHTKITIVLKDTKLSS